MSGLSSAAAVPDGFRVLRLPPNGFIDTNGPLYGRRDGDAVVFGFRVEPRHCNPAGSCHGGMLMTFADMVLGIGTNHQADLNRFLPTVNLTCDFLAPGVLGAWVEGRAEVLRVTRTLVFAQAVIAADGQPILRASGVMKVPSTPDSRFHLDDLLA